MTTWIPILVRREDYPEIARLVAGREADRNDAESDTSTHEVRVASVTNVKPTTHEDEQLANHVPWSIEDLRELATGRTTTTQRWARAMDVCAESPGHYLPTSEVAKLAGMTINEWRDAPRKITRHLRAHYPNVPRDEKGEAYWPLCPGGDGIPANGGEVWWAMTAEMARRWSEVRDQQHTASVDIGTDS